MPDHLHSIIHLPEKSSTIYKVIGNAKRFMTYDIVERLEKINRTDILKIMQKGVSEKDKLSNHHHKVFQPSFNAIAFYDYTFLQEKLNCIPA